LDRLSPKPPIQDGEFAVEGELEIFEPGDSNLVPDRSRSLPIHSRMTDPWYARYQMRFESSDDQQDIQNIATLLAAGLYGSPKAAGGSGRTTCSSRTSWGWITLRGAPTSQY